MAMPLIAVTYSGADQNQRVQADGTSYVNAPLGVSSLTTSAGTTYYTRDNRGNLVEERPPGGGRFYYLFDGLGSIVGITDSGGALEGNQRYQYDPYGTLLSQPSNGTLQSNPWRFAAGQFDSGTGLTKFGIRYDDTTTGRWTQRMPVGGSLQEMTKANPYACTEDNPVNVVDPSGRDCVTDFVLTIIADVGTTFGGFATLVALLDAAIAGATIGGILIISWVSFPILALIGAYFTAELIMTCFYS